MLDLLTEAQLNELFDADSLGTVYPVENLTPKAKVPQMLHMKVPGTNDLVIRLTHLDTVGTRVKAVVQGDKTVQVFLMSLSEKGNITDFRGGLGSDPVGAINTMFTTVMDIAKKFRFESVLFRFTKTKMKGKSAQVQRVLGRLITQRSAGRFTSMEEVTRAESKKFDFVLALRKNSDLIEDLAKDAPGYTKVETKAGTVFVNDENGQNVSKADVAAAVLTQQSAKLSDQTIVSKSKVSRRDAMRALYSVVDSKAEATFHNAEEIQKHSEINANIPNVVKNLGPEANIIDRVNRKELDFNRFINYTGDKSEMRPTEETFVTDMRAIVRYELNRKEVVPEEQINAIAYPLIQEIGKVFDGLTALNQQSKYEEVSQLIVNFPLLGHKDSDARKKIMRNIMAKARKFVSYQMHMIYMEDANTDQMRSHYSEAQKKAISEYCGQSYERINDYLIGKESKIKPQLETQINELDAAFENGMRVPKGTVLYRGQMLPWVYVEPILEKKIMYFRNYISTSLAPIIYGGFTIEHVVDAMAPDATDITNMAAKDFVRATVEKRWWDEDADTFTDKIYAEKTMYAFGLVIKGADKINTITPGKISPYPDECEVILPRGTMLRVNRISSNNLETTRDTLGSHTPDAALLVDTTVIAPEQIDESEGYEIIDGDLFLSEGVVKTIKPGSFSAYYTQDALNEAVKNTEAFDLLASCVNLDELSKKFK